MAKQERLVRQPYGAYNHLRVGKEDTEITHVGRGTPCGEYLRRFWQPVCIVSELKDVPLKLRILGEDLIAFRDKSGNFGLMESRCLHRGASLEFGKIAEHGIQCAYHGLHIDCDGSILEVPFDPYSKRKDKLCQAAYPVLEYNGLLFAYMGPPEEKPPFPLYDLYFKRGTTYKQWKEHSPCNWLQVRENELDPVHVTFLHTRLYGVQFNAKNGALPTLEWQETPLGVTYIIARRWKDKIVTRNNDMIMPNMCRVAGNEDGEGTTDIVFDRRGGTTNWVVPIDDTNCWTIGWDDVESVVGEPHLDGNMDRKRRAGEKLVGPFDVGQSGTPTYAERQKAPGDWDMWTSQGAITSHKDEILFATDEGVSMYRKLVRAGVRDVAGGRTPKNLHRELPKEPLRTYSNNSVFMIPPARTEEEDRALCRKTARSLADRLFAFQVAPYIDQPATERENATLEGAHS
jgi:nitrite reductase/ring-hydroxylating ferredoxin subunit